MIPGNANPLLLASAAAAGAVDVDIPKSLRFNGNGNDDSYLERSVSSASNRRTFTFAAWVKNDVKTSNHDRIFSAGTSSNDVFDITLSADSEGTHLRIFNKTSGSVNTNWNTANKFRDPSAWFQVVCAVDTTQATSTDRVKVYINGTHITQNGTTNTLPSQNTQLAVSSATTHYIGRSGPFTDGWLAGYLTDIYFIDGSALDASSFGAYDDNGVWQPAAYSGTFGTNGFHLLDFANESTIGHDSSGNNNDFTAYNFSPVAGDPSYLTETTLSGSIYSGAGGKEKIFDGTTATAGPSQGSSITFTPSPSITISSSLRIRANVSNVNGDAVLQINGTNYQTSNLSFPASGNIGNAASTWVTIPSPPSTLTSLRFGWEAHWIAVSGIEIDGVELLSDPGALDILFDSPVNGDQSDTGDGGELSGNYAVWNPTPPGSGSTYPTLSNGNLDASLPASGKAAAQTIFPESGKWYCEMKFVSGGGAGGGLRIGVINEKNIAVDLGSTANSWAYLADGRVYHNASAPSYGVSSAPGDTLMMALDIDAGKLWYGKNGSWMASGNPAAGSNPSQTFTAGQKMSFSAQSGSGTVQVISTNWGQREWLYNAPSGFKAVCTANLATPTIADGGDYFNAFLWTGNGNNTRSLTGLGFNPDAVWFKARNSGNDHNLIDAVRGANKTLIPNRSNSETTNPIHGYLTSFDSDGFSVTNGSFGKGDVNESNRNYVAWCWDAGSSTASNTDGSITSQVRVNQTAGFSIVTYTYPSSGTFTVGHGLNAAPGMIISKHRNRTAEWYVWHSAFTSEDDYINLDSTAAKGTATDFWGTSVPGSSTFGGKIGTSGLNGDTDVVYCFAPVAGFSSFGTYEGNASTDGPFVYTGFRPRWVLRKSTTFGGTGYDWVIIDTSRDPENISNNKLYPNHAGVENVNSDGSDTGDNSAIDILSNGFKVRASNGRVNKSGETFIYAAFAENPFSANGGLAR